MRAELLNCFLKFKGISVNCYFKIARCMAAGQIAHRIAGQEKNHSRLAGSFAQLPQRVLLVRREPVFQKVNVVWHSSLCLPPSSIRAPLPARPSDSCCYAYKAADGTGKAVH